MESSVAQTEDDLITIVPHGDIILDIHSDDEHDENTEMALFRVDGTTLSQGSAYFQQLLDPKKWKEGKSTSQQLEKIRRNDSKVAWSKVSWTLLPRIEILGVGEISPVKTIKPLMTDFLKLLHGIYQSSVRKRMPLTNVANLAIVADRFDAAAAISRAALQGGLLRDPLPVKAKVDHEEQIRQMIVIGLLLGYEAWITKPSQNLLIAGSKQWHKSTRIFSDISWWDLPRGLEEETQTRRTFLIDTIFSLQTYLLEQFSSRNRQCRLGYDSSPACDSFQLGEFVKFLTRMGTLQLYGDNNLSSTFSGNLLELIASLRTFPGYQLDRNHSHCGPRKLLVAGLEYIEKFIHRTALGIEWHMNGGILESWSANRPLLWKNQDRIPGGDGVRSGTANANRHYISSAREFFTAVEKDWNTLR